MDRAELSTKTVGVVMWNINGLSGKRNYMKVLLDECVADVVILSETKMKRPVIQHEDIGSDKYNIIQIRSIVYGRGGLVVLAKKELQLITAEMIRDEEGDNFIKAVVLFNKYK